MRVTFRLALLSVFSFFWAGQLAAQQPQLRFERLGTDQGLSQNYIQALAVDLDGFVWVGTQDGVNRYDGYQFKTYGVNPDVKDGLRNNIIYCMAVDRENQVWAGTYDGLAVYDRQQDRFRSFDKGMPWENQPGTGCITALAEDETGGMWIGTAHHGLIYWDGKTAHAFTVPLEEKSDRAILYMIADEGGVWINTENFQLWFFSYATKTFKAHHPPVAKWQGISRFRIIEKEGDYLLGAAKDGLHLYDPNRFLIWPWEETASKKVHEELYQSQILETDRWGRIWAGGTFGLCSLEPATRRVYYYRTSDEVTSISDNRVTAMILDQSDQLWVGTTNGLNRLSLDRPFRHYAPNKQADNALIHAYVLGFAEDRYDQLWISTAGGLSRLDPASHVFHNYTTKSGHDLASNWVRCLKKTADGTLWLGYEGQGVGRWDEQNDRFINYPPPKENPISVLAILENPDHTFWLATLRGLIYFDPKTGQYGASLAQGLTLLGRNCFALTYDPAGTLWAGFMDGLFQVDPGGQMTQHLAGPDGVVATTTPALLPDAGGVLWVGTTDGLIRYHPESKKARLFQEAEGLPNKTIYALVRDKDGFLWISTNKGLSRLDPQTLTFSNYRISSGLQSDEFNHGASFQRKNGEILFGGVNGYNAFRMEEVAQKQEHVPQIVFTDLRLLNKVVTPEPTPESPLPQALNELDQVVLQPQSRLVSFEFAATHIPEPKEVVYAWQMDGLDAQWVHTEVNRRMATFTGLPARDYVFRVKAGVKGEWGPERTLAVKVLPPLWQTKQAYALYVLLGVVLLIGGYRLKSRKLRIEQARMIRFNQELEAQVEERTAQLAEARHDLLEEAHLSGMAEIASNVLHSVGNTLNSVQASAYLLTEQFHGKETLTHLEHLELLLQQDEQAFRAFLSDPARRGLLLEFVTRMKRRLEKDNALVEQEGARLIAHLTEARTILQEQQIHALPTDQYLARLSLNQIVTHTVARKGHLLKSRNIDVVLDLAPVAEAAVDETKLQRVLFYLFKNALEAIEEIGRVVGQVVISTREQDEHVVLMVTDNGCGLAQETDRLYELGYTTKSKARGFGLHYCANAISEMGGRIRIASPGPGKGCSVALMFPS